MWPVFRLPKSGLMSWRFRKSDAATIRSTSRDFCKHPGIGAAASLHLRTASSHSRLCGCDSLASGFTSVGERKKFLAEKKKFLGEKKIFLGEKLSSPHWGSIIQTFQMLNPLLSDESSGCAS
jgi:hypothetical protein